MADNDMRPRKKRSAKNCCGTGCGSALLLLMLIFAIGYAFTGRYQVRVPPPKRPPAINGFNDYVAAGKLLSQNGGTKAIYPSGGFSVSLVAEKEVVAANQPVLALVRTGLTKDCLVPIDRSWNALYPYLAQSRDVARLLMADADVKAARGDQAGAFSSGLDCLQMGQDIARGGPIIHELVGIAVQAI